MAPETDFRLVVCMDHLTPLSIRTHSDEPVPLLIYDSRQQGMKSNLSFSEKNAEESGILLAGGKEFFHRLLQKRGTP